MARLTGWSKRIKLTTDCTKIDADLTHFPITVFLKAGNGDTQKVFDEVGANKYKIAIADDSNPPVQYYVEIEQWDATNKVGILHFGKTGEILPSTSDKNFYLYYDNTHADNTNYVGEEGSTPAQNVWETAAKGVWHMNDNPDTSHIKDSTSNTNNGTKKAANEPAETSGKVAKGQSFDGSNDYIDCGNSDVLDSQLQYTVLAWVYPKVLSDWKAIVIHRHSTSSSVVLALWTYNNKIRVQVSNNDRSSQVEGPTQTLTLSLNQWQQVALTIDSSGDVKLWLNGASEEMGTVSGPFTNFNLPLEIGRHRYDSYPNGIQFFNGYIDEVRIYTRGLSAAEIKATYHSTNDSLLSYGTEETSTYTLTAEYGSFSLTGQASGLLKAFKLMAEAGTFVLTGIASGLLKISRLIAETGNFVLTGISAGFLKGFSIIAETGTFVLTGISVGFSKTFKLIAETGNFVLTGISSNFLRIFKLIAGAGNFILTGIATVLRYKGWKYQTKHTTNWTEETKHTTNWNFQDKS